MQFAAADDTDDMEFQVRTDDAVRMPDAADYRWLIPVVRGNAAEPFAFVRWWPRSVGDPPCKIAPAVASFHDPRRRVADGCGEIEARSHADLVDAMRAIAAGAPLE